MALFLNIKAQDIDTTAAANSDTIITDELKIGDIRAGNFSKSVHVIKLLDEKGLISIKSN